MKCPECGHKFVLLSDGARVILRYMIQHAPARGGYMFEGARPAFESGTYLDQEIAELLRVGAIKPHPDTAKGWIVANPALEN